MNNANTFSGRLIERRLSRSATTLSHLREELRMVEEQLDALTDDATEKEIRLLVAETPSAALEHREAKKHVDTLRGYRAQLNIEICAVIASQDVLLDRLGG